MLCALSAAVSHGDASATAALLCSRQGPAVCVILHHQATGTAPYQDSVSSGCAHLWPRVGNLGSEHSGSTVAM